MMVTRQWKIMIETSLHKPTLEKDVPGKVTFGAVV
jgi:hypothetical protein